MQTTHDKVHEPEVRMKQAEESSLPNELPNTRRFQEGKPEFGRTVGLLGAVILLFIVLVMLTAS